MTTTTVTTIDVPRTDIRAAAGVNDALLTIGRIFIALIFVSSGVQKFMGLDAIAAEISTKLPYPNVLAVLTASLETVGGLLIIFGWQTRIAALALALFCLVAAYFFHDFWHLPAGAEYTNMKINFMKNVSIFGGFLILAAVGAGRYSLDGPCIRHRQFGS